MKKDCPSKPRANEAEEDDEKHVEDNEDGLLTFDRHLVDSVGVHRVPHQAHPALSRLVQGTHPPSPKKIFSSKEKNVLIRD